MTSPDRRPRSAWQLVAQAWGQNIRSERHRQDLTQIELATRAGITQSVVSEIETGSYRSLTPNLILAICAAFGVEPSVLCPWPPGIGMVAAHEREVAA